MGLKSLLRIRAKHVTSVEAEGFRGEDVQAKTGDWSSVNMNSRQRLRSMHLTLKTCHRNHETLETTLLSIFHRA